MPRIRRGGRQGAGSLVVAGAKAFIMDDATFPAVRSGEVTYASRVNDGSGQASPTMHKGKVVR